VILASYSPALYGVFLREQLGVVFIPLDVLLVILDFCFGITLWVFFTPSTSSFLDFDFVFFVILVKILTPV
jgi:hypothetical protein